MNNSTKTNDPKTASGNFYKLFQIENAAVKYASIFLFFGVLVFGIYYGSLESPFTFDDILRIEKNRHIRMTQLSPQNIFDAGFKSSKSRPFAYISFALNYYFGRYDPFGYHIVNIFIHFLTGCFLFVFIRTTFKTPALQNQYRHPDLIAFLTAVIWLANPVQSQAVTYIVQRMTSLASLFFILSFWFYVKGRLVDRSRNQWLWYIGSLLAWLVSLGCKQITVTLPFLVLLYEWYFFQDLSREWLKRSLKWVLGITVCIVIIGLIYTDFHPFEKFSRFHDFLNNEFTITQRALTQLRVVIYYISLLFFPHPSRLSLEYDFPLSYSLVNPITTLLSAVIILSLVILAIYLAKKERLISFCMLWFFTNLVLESSVIPLALIFEHRLYLPSMLVFLPVVILFWRFIKPAWLPVSIVCVFFALSAYGTVVRNNVWRDDISLWTDSVKKAPNRARPYSNLGFALSQKERFDEALPNFLKALELDPDLAQAHYNLGYVLDQQGQTEAAVQHYRKAIQLIPEFARSYNNLGLALMKLDKINEAVENYHKAIQLNPNFAYAYNNLGLALMINEEIEDAAKNYRKALELDPELEYAHLNLATVLTKQGRTDEAISHLKKALQINSDYAEAHSDLGSHLLSQGKTEEALEHINTALKIKPEVAEAHNNIGIILIHKGKISEAIYHFQETVRINPEFELGQENLRRALAILQTNSDAEFERIQLEIKTRPDDPKLNFVLGNLYLGMGELNSAIGQYQKALSVQPNFPQALNNLAIAHTLDRQYDQALEVFQKLISLQPANPANHYNVAVLYALQNKESEALAWLNKAVTNGYDNWDLIKTDKDLDSIRNSEGYRELVKGR